MATARDVRESGAVPASKEYAAISADGGGPVEKFAVYVVAEAGATIVCVWAPPLDQDENVYDEPPRVCGETALTEFAEPMITVRVNGAAACVGPTTSWSRLGSRRT